jgi:hypothetical protein
MTSIFIVVEPEKVETKNSDRLSRGLGGVQSFGRARGSRMGAR